MTAEYLKPNVLLNNTAFDILGSNDMSNNAMVG